MPSSTTSVVREGNPLEPVSAGRRWADMMNRMAPRVRQMNCRATDRVVSMESNAAPTPSQASCRERIISGWGLISEPLSCRTSRMATAAIDASLRGIGREAKLDQGHAVVAVHNLEAFGLEAAEHAGEQAGAVFRSDLRVGGAGAQELGPGIPRMPDRRAQQFAGYPASPV